MKFTIQSLQDSNRRYVVSESSLHDDWRNRDRSLSEYIGHYDTMGDGETAHTPTGQVGADLLLDFLRSVAVEFPRLCSDARQDLARLMARDVRYGCVTYNRVRAALKVKHREKGKRRYYNLNDLSVSGAASKEFDKRYSEITKWQDGGFASVVGLVGISGGLLAKYSSVALIGDMYENITGEYATDPAEFLEWLGYSSRKWDLRDAYRVVERFVQAAEYARDAERSAECLRGNLKRSAELAAM